MVHPLCRFHGSAQGDYGPPNSPSPWYPPSEEALESKVHEVFANRSVLAFSYDQRSAHDVDLSLPGLESDDRADLLARFRFSTYIVEGQRIRPLTTEEIQSQVSAWPSWSAIQTGVIPLRSAALASAWHSSTSARTVSVWTSWSLM